MSDLSMRKMLWGTLALVLVLVVGGVGWLYLSLDSIVASAIRSYGPEMTQVSVRLNSVQLDPRQGLATLKQLELGSPKGFAMPRVFYVGQIRMKLDTSSITEDTVLIQEISIDQPEITYEYASGGSNLDVIQRNVERYIAKKIGASKSQKSDGRQKKVVIENLYIRGARAKVSAGVLQGKALSVPVPDIHLKGIGKKSGGATVAEAARQVLNAMTKSVSQSVSSVGRSIKGFFQ